MSISLSLHQTKRARMLLLTHVLSEWSLACCQIVVTTAQRGQYRAYVPFLILLALLSMQRYGDYHIGCAANLPPPFTKHSAAKSLSKHIECCGRQKKIKLK